MNLPQRRSVWKRKFAWYPIKLSNSTFIFLKHYWTNEVYMQNPYNGAKGFVIQEKISEYDRVVNMLSK
jgi:hypothetical protein